MTGAFAFLAFAIAASGFIIATQCYKFKFEVARQSGHRLYLTVITYGFLPAIPASVLLLFFIPPESSAYPLWLALIILIISIAFTIWHNKHTPDAKQTALLKAWKQDDLESVCSAALLHFRPVAVSLENRKVYIGYVADTLEPSEDASYISIIPIRSGYRDKETMQLRLTHKYDSIITALFEGKTDVDERYLIVIPRNRIMTINIFNDHLYSEISGEQL